MQKDEIVERGYRRRHGCVLFAGCSQKKEQVEIKSGDDLWKLSIGVQSGTTGDTYTTRHFTKAGIEEFNRLAEESGEEKLEVPADTSNDATIARYNKATDAAQDLKNGRIDCVVVDKMPAQKIVDKNSDLQILGFDLTEDKMDLILEYLEKANIDVVNSSIEETGKEDDLLLGDEDDIILSEEDEVEIIDDVDVLEGVSTEDPVRMYLKEIGKVNLLSSDEEIELAQAMDAGNAAKEQLAELQAAGEEIPAEVRQAKAIVADRTQIINEANREAETIVRVAEEKAKAMVNQDEIVRQAQQKANELIAQAQQKFKEMRKASSDYVDDLMRRADESLSEQLAELRKTRQSIKASQRNLQS